jgi:formylglycine-generating enzyme required for sulfatase activity
MTSPVFIILLAFIFICTPTAGSGKEVPKIAIWDLEPRNTPETHARELTSFVVSEITKLKKYEVYSQENVRTLAGWTAERMKLGCTDRQCLTALGQMDIAKLVSGSVGKIGKRYTVSLNLFDTQNARSQNAISKTCDSEDELIELIQASVLELLGEGPPAQPPERAEPRPPAARTVPGDYRDPATGMEFLLVQGGCYQMGNTFGDGNLNEMPVHEVCVNDFYLGKYEVTVGEFRRFVAETGYRTEAERGDGCIVHKGDKWEKERDKNWRTPDFSQDDRHPVVCVSWNDAKAFAEWMKGKGGRDYRLLTEAEWEYAARSRGKNYKYSWGNGPPAGNVADISLKRQFPGRPWPIWEGYDDGYVFTAPVGRFPPNELGFYDLTGNIWEWVSDWYDENYYKMSPKENPQGPASGQLKALRSGSWFNPPRENRASDRGRFVPADRSAVIGFRLGFAPR